MMMRWKLDREVSSTRFCVTVYIISSEQWADCDSQLLAVWCHIAFANDILSSAAAAAAAVRC